ncbi:RICIN domain-containing protein [Flavobacterium sp. CF136]|uniref:RICIN domain-containing protein n=1 Tax=Flavobacterium sp. (strain CF136) TaxID=1144313 RepID=UPI0002719610|nr:RICIN domain-containing protein [Flavobacterium sp. CF136]EJL67211.1 Por secretion system C-terminal sorting domain-containing protein [Flavobacterium sp. CF136]
MKNHLCNVKIFFLYLVLVFSPVLTNAQTYGVKHASLGGGGYVTGIITHQKSRDIYCRTDVGGAYRWDAATSKWVQLLDWISEEERNFSGVEAMALDPQNANTIYMLCGLDYYDFGKTAILKSTDKGNTFTSIDVTSKFKAHGNGRGRSTGERLTVDPKNSNILFCGTRANGLWKSTDAGVTWNQAWKDVTTTANGNGICFVLFDPSGSVVNGVSQTMYIGVSRTGSANIYKSTNGGATFTAISATTDFIPNRAALTGTTMYVTHGDEDGLGRLYKLNTSAGTWTNVTPNANNYSYGGVSVDPSNVNRVVVSTIARFNNDQYGTTWGDFIYLSTNGGTDWTLTNGSNSTYNNDGIGWSNGQLHWAGSAEFTPGNTAEVRVVSGNGLFTCSNINAASPSWKFDVRGMEETGLNDGISIPGGPVITAFGDITGFVHNDLTSYPASTHQPAGGSNGGIDYAAANTSKLVRTTNGDKGASYVYYSTNKGSTWTACSTTKGVAGKVAISADGGTILHCPVGSSTTWRTNNNGDSWTSVGGVAISNTFPVADRVNSNYFYIHNQSSGEMLVSSNNGVSFSVAGNPGATTTSWVPTFIRTVPGYEGHIWVPLVGNGLKYSTDHGATYTTVSNVPYCTAVGIGKAMAGASYPTIFIWGTVGGMKGLFRSTDKGANWIRVNDDAHEFGGTTLIFGDLNVFGRVYVWGLSARGLIYWEPAAPSVTYVSLANRATGLRMDGMGKTTEGSNCAQWSSSESVNQQWIIETVGNYVMLKNRATGLYIDGMYRTTKGFAAGQHSYSGTNAQYWTRETAGSYVKFKNKETGFYLDGMGLKTNGADLGQWSSSSHNNQQWTITTVGNGQTAKMGSISTDDIAEEPNFSINFSPNPFVNDFKIEATKSNEPIRVSIFDMLGKKVETAESSLESGQLLMGSSLKPGLYIVQVEGVNLNFSKSFKIIKK